MISDGQPSPSSFFVTGGTVPMHAASYVQRKADADLLTALQGGDYCFVLNSRQMGKSSLSVRTIAKLNAAGVQTAFIDLTKVGAQNVTAEQWYAGLLAETGRGLNLRKEFVQYWKEQAQLPPVQRYFGALREVALNTITSPIVVFIDEIDAVRSLSFLVDEFFAAVRACYNSRTEDETYQRLTFCLVGAATPADLISDTRMSPFNIGRRIELKDFTAEEAAPLAAHLPGGKPALDRVLYWTGGQPYLTQRLCRAVVEEPGTPVDKLCDSLFLSKSAQESDDNISFVRNRLLKSEVDLASLLDLYGKVRSGKKVRDDETNPLCGVLRLSGACKLDRDYLAIRNRIYDHVFDKQWVLAHLPDAEVRRQKEAYRKGTLRTGLAAGVIVAIVAALALFASSQAKRARLSATQLRVALDESERTSYINAMNVAQSAYENNNIGRTLALLEETKNSRFKGFEWDYWSNLCLQGSVTTNGHKGMVNAVAFSPDEQRVASASSDGTARVWDAKTGRELLVLTGHTSWVYCVAFSPDGRLIATGSADNTVKIWDSKTGKVLSTLLGHTDSIDSVSFSHNNRRLVTGSQDLTAKVWDLENGKEIITIKKRRNGTSARDVIFSIDDRRIIVGYTSHDARLWDVESGREIFIFKGHGEPISSLAASPDGRKLITGSADHTAKVWDIQSGKELLTLHGHRNVVIMVSFSPDGNHIFTGGLDNTICIWDAVSGKQIRNIKGRGATPNTIAISPVNQNVIAVGSTDGRVQFYNTDSNRELITFQGMKDSIPDVALSPDGRHVAGILGNGPVKVWNAQTGREELTISALSFVSVAFSPDGTRLATSNWAGSPNVFDAKTGRLLFTLKAKTKGPCWSVVFSPDGRYIATGSSGSEYSAKIWDASTGHELLTLKGHIKAILGVTFSPDSSKVATASEDGTAKIWDTNTGRELITTKGHGNYVNSAVFSANSKLLLTSSGDSTARIWDVISGKELKVFSGHSSGLNHACFSPDSKRVVTSSFDNTTKIWDAVTGREVLTLKGEKNAYRSVFSPDSKTLATTNSDGTIRLWETSPLTPELRRERIEVRLAQEKTKANTLLRWRGVIGTYRADEQKIPWLRLTIEDDLLALRGTGFRWNPLTGLSVNYDETGHFSPLPPGVDLAIEHDASGHVSGIKMKVLPGNALKLSPGSYLLKRTEEPQR